MTDGKKDSVSQELAELALSDWTFDDETLAQASLVMADAIGVSVLGSSMPWSVAVRQATEELGGNAHATIVGQTQKSSAYWAALVNGTFAHANDFDDTYRNGPLHPSAGAWTALPMAEWLGSTGADAVAAFIVYYEVCARLADACFVVPPPGEPPAVRGFQAQALCGVFASTLASARLLNMDVPAAASALGIAGSYPGGLLEFLNDGSDSKRFHFGKASSQGIMTALMGRNGFQGPRYVFEGSKGFFHAYVGAWDESMRKPIFDGFGSRWAVFDSITKRWPGLGGNEPPVEVALSLMRERGWSGADIERVDVDMRVHFIPYAFGVQPTEGCRRVPANRFEAEMSLPFQIALVLAHDRYPIVADFLFDPGAIDRELLDLASRVTVTGNPAYDRMPQSEAARACKVTIVHKSGEQAVEEFIGAGVPTAMVSAEIAEKFEANVRPITGPDGAKDLWRKASALHQLAGVGEVMHPLAHQV